MSIESRRKAAGMTRRALADAIGATEQALVRWEAGKNPPSKKFVQRLAMVFECSVDELELEIYERWQG